MKRWLCVSGSIGFAVASGAQAQSQVHPPQTVNPLQNLPQAQAPSTKPRVSTSVQARPANPQLAALLSRAITPDRFEVSGVHAVPFAEIAALFSPMTGKRVTVGDLVAASTRIAEVYKRHGYALSFGYIPAQQFGNGIVHVTRHYTIDLSLAEPFGDRPLETKRRESRWNLTFSYQLH